MIGPKRARNRGKLELALDIIHVIRAPCRFTAIQYKTGMAASALKRHLRTLKKTGYLNIETEGSHEVFSLTRKGKKLQNIQKAFNPLRRAMEGEGNES